MYGARQSHYFFSRTAFFKFPMIEYVLRNKTPRVLFNESFYLICRTSKKKAFLEKILMHDR